MVTVFAVSRPTRCAYCHSNMVGGFSECSRCGSACHHDCMRLARGCPTFGCSGRQQRRRPAPSQWGVGRFLRSVWSALEFFFKAAFVLGSIAILAAIAWSNLTGHHGHSNGTAAIGALKTLGTAQSLFREADKDKDGELDYAENLKQLGTCGTTGLIDSVLASGTKNGYHFELQRSTTLPEFCWIAVAWPQNAERNGRAFVTNHEGVTFYRDVKEGGGMVLIDTNTCAIPSGWTPIGR